MRWRRPVQANPGYGVKSSQLEDAQAHIARSRAGCPGFAGDGVEGAAPQPVKSTGSLALRLAPGGGLAIRFKAAR
jgi:hypothetical protein